MYHFKETFKVNLGNLPWRKTRRSSTQVIVLIALTGGLSLFHAHSEANTSTEGNADIEIEVDCLDAKINPGGAEWCDAVRAEKKYAVADKKLNETYKLLMRSMLERDRALWRDSQRKWLSYLKANCTAIATAGSPSSAVRQWNYMECLTEQTTMRTGLLLKIANQKIASNTRH
jgi:uncharacterized protein YecT (DUF1311 family)